MEKRGEWGPFPARVRSWAWGPPGGEESAVPPPRDPLIGGGLLPWAPPLAGDPGPTHIHKGRGQRSGPHTPRLNVVSPSPRGSGRSLRTPPFPSGSVGPAVLLRDPGPHPPSPFFLFSCGPHAGRSVCRWPVLGEAGPAPTPVVAGARRLHSPLFSPSPFPPVRRSGLVKSYRRCENFCNGTPLCYGRNVDGSDPNERDFTRVPVTNGSEFEIPFYNPNLIRIQNLKSIRMAWMRWILDILHLTGMPLGRNGRADS